MRTGLIDDRRDAAGRLERDCLGRRVHHRRLTTSIPSKESDVDRRFDETNRYSMSALPD
jgi:hypothetical protein